MTEVRVLGTFEVYVQDGAPADLGGLRQRSVLARLVVAQGAMVPADRLVEELWPDEAPPRALAGIQSFVSHLRRALEPGRAPRTPAQVLVTAPPGYALRLPAGSVDAWRFDAHLDEAGELMEAAEPASARSQAEAALRQWHGPAYAEFAHLPWAATEAARLDERRRIAVERRAEAMLMMRAAAEAVPDLEAHAAANPLREEAWRLLALALYRTARQGDALAVLRRARATLAEELGVDPGPALQRLEADILSQAPGLSAPSVSRELAVVRDLPLPSAEPHRGEGGFVGREGELGQLRDAASAALDARRCTVALIGGDAGAGKTALTDRLAGELGAAGWRHAWGRVPETDGAPAAWPWAELLRELAADTPPRGEVAAMLAPLLDDGAPDGDEAGRGDAAIGRFRLHRGVGDYLGHIAERGPLLLVLDDAHRADDETLALLAQLPDRLRGRAVLVLVTFRTAEVTDGLADTLAALARHEPVRIDLGGLTGPEVAELVRAVCATEVDDETVAVIAERTDGNPFFARETARLLESEGAAAAMSAVPAGVGDVLRRRLARLPATARTILRQAAVVGRDLDAGVLTELAGDPELVLDAIESALVSGLITEPVTGRVRFAHALVRDTLYGDLSRLRRARLHAKVAACLERRSPEDVAAIAHHYLAAGTAPDRALHYARLAAERAEARFAHRAAAALWERAAELAEPAGGSPRDRLESTIRVIRASALAGDLVSARAKRGEAIAEARVLGDLELLARVIVCFGIPTLWTSRRYGTFAHDVVEAAEECLAGLPDGDGELRTRLLTTLAMELDGEETDRGAEVSLEAVEMARRLGGPELLAVALNGRFLNSFRTAGGLAERLRIGREILELAERNGLGLYEVLGHMMLEQSAAGSLDLATAMEHVSRGRELAVRYELPLLAMLAEWLHGMRHTMAGRFEEAESAYTEVGEAIARTGLWGAEQGMMFLGVFCLRLQQGRIAELLGQVDWIAEDWGHLGVAADVRALILFAAGRVDEARRAVSGAPPIRRDYFFDLSMALRAKRAIALGERELAEQTYAALCPFEDMLAGGGTAAVTIGPVALILGELAAFLGRPGQAVRHYRRAAVAAERVGSRHWAAAAAEALHDLGMPAA